MDQDDPEKRIADLEHQLADQKHGADLPPGQPPQQANAARGTGSGAPKPASVGASTWPFVGLLGKVCVGGLGAPLILYGAVLAHNHRGKPTTATIDHWVWYTISGGLFLVATGLVLWWSARRKYKDR